MGCFTARAQDDEQARARYLSCKCNYVNLCIPPHRDHCGLSASRGAGRSHGIAALQTLFHGLFFDSYPNACR